VHRMFVRGEPSQHCGRGARQIVHADPKLAVRLLALLTPVRAQAPRCQRCLPLRSPAIPPRQQPVKALQRIGCDDLAVVDDDHAVAQALGFFHVVRRVHSVCPRALSVSRLSRWRWLCGSTPTVGSSQQNVRIVHERARNVEAALHASVNVCACPWRDRPSPTRSSAWLHRSRSLARRHQTGAKSSSSRALKIVVQSEILRHEPDRRLTALVSRESLRRQWRCCRCPARPRPSIETIVVLPGRWGEESTISPVEETHAPRPRAGRRTFEDRALAASVWPYEMRESYPGHARPG